jgi:tetratricopeptide (TPR) repeat protein
LKRATRLAIVTAQVACLLGTAALAEYLDTIKQAEKAEESGDKTNAEKLFKQAVLEAGNNSITGAYSNAAAGKFYTRTGKYADAEKCLKQAIEYDHQYARTNAERKERLIARVSAKPRPDSNPVISFLNGQMIESEKRQLKNERAMDTLLPFGDEPEHISDLAMCYDTQGRHSDADALWVKAIKMQPELRTSLEELADTTNWKLHQPDKSIELYKRALGIRQGAIAGARNQQLAAMYHYLGNIYLRRGKFEDSDKCFKTSLNLWKQLPVTDYASAWAKCSTMEDYVRLLKKSNRLGEASEYTADITALKAKQTEYLNKR